MFTDRDDQQVDNRETVDKENEKRDPHGEVGEEIGRTRDLFGQCAS